MRPILAALGAIAALAAPLAGHDTAGRCRPAEYAYVTNYGDATLSAYRVDGSTGALTEIDGSPYATEPNPNDVVVDPTNRYVYVVHGDGTKLTAYRIGAGGALTPLPGSPFAAVPAGFGDFTSAAVDHSGRFLYATDALNEKIRGYALDPVTGAPALMSGSGFPLGNNGDAMTVHPSGRFAYAGAFLGGDGLSGYTVKASTGALSRIAGTPVSVGERPSDSAVDRTGRYLLVANLGSNDVSRFSVDRATGFPTWLGNTAAGNGPTALAITPSTRFVYVTNGLDGTVSAYALDRSSGALDAVPGGPFFAGAFPNGLAVHPSSRFLYTADRVSDTVTGFAIGEDGGLTTLPGSPFASGLFPSAIAMTR